MHSHIQDNEPLLFFEADDDTQLVQVNMNIGTVFCICRALRAAVSLHGLALQRIF